MPEHSYGWRPSLPDQRDYELARIVRPGAPLPPHVDLRPLMPPVYDQGRLGSCTANAIGAAVQYERRRQGLPDFVPSRLLLYYAERALEGTTRSDSGAALRDGLKVVSKTGVCPEPLWPYVPGRFAARPPASAYREAGKHLATGYYAVPQDQTAMRAALAANLPISVGFTVYSSFESDAVARTGYAPMPSPTETVLGGHAVLVTGYDDATQRWLCRNSWSADWGDAGYFTLPYLYLLHPQLSGDFWVISTESA